MINIVAIITTAIINIAMEMSSKQSGQEVSAIVEAAKTHKFLFIGYILFLFITLIFTVLVWIASSRYQDVVKRDADSKIADANAIAEKAKNDASKADEKAEEARTKQNELEQKNLTLRGEVAKLQKEAAIAQRDLMILQEKVKPRKFTEEQKTQLITTLKANPKGNIYIECINGDAESCGFAKQIAEILSLAGWKIIDLRDVITFSKGGQPRIGMAIIVKSRESSPIRAAILQKALAEVGVNAPGELRNALSDDEVQLFVGVKPN